jgi:c-di-GMP-binding flagellar brake protein YcgR
MKIERRKYTRINIITDVIINSIKDNSSFRGVITNISAGGIGVILTTPLEVGTDVSISFKLTPKLNFENIRGFVTRTEYIGDRFFVFVGINFLNMEAEKRAQFNKYVLDKKLEEFNFKKENKKMEE